MKGLVHFPPAVTQNWREGCLGVDKSHDADRQKQRTKVVRDFVEALIIYFCSHPAIPYSIHIYSLKIGFQKFKMFHIYLTSQAI